MDFFKKYKRGFIGAGCAVIALIVLYFVLQAMGRPMPLKSLIYGLAAVVLIIVAGIMSSRTSQKNAEVLARVYLNGDTAYSRAGETEHFSDVEGAVAACAVIMNNFNPRAKQVKPPEDFVPLYSVNTSDYRNDGEVWEGVFRIADPLQEIPFKSEEELTKIITEHVVIEPSGMWVEEADLEVESESVAEESADSEEESRG